MKITRSLVLIPLALALALAAAACKSRPVPAPAVPGQQDANNAPGQLTDPAEAPAE